MDTQVETKSLRERVAQVVADKERERAEIAKKKAQKAREHLKAKMMSVLAVNVEVSDIAVLGAEPFVTVEDFEFTLDWFEGRDSLAHLQKCGACGERYKRLIYSVSSLADTFVPYPHNEAFCLKLAAQPAEPQTTEERLLQALRDFIADNSYRPE